MFQALGTHGPELSPTMGLVLDVLLLGAAFWLLAGPNRRSVHDVVLMATLVVSVSLVRVVMQPLPNIQPVTVACLLVGAQLGARRGAAFAVMVTMLSNFFMGDGWWTLFQAGGWVMVAVLGSRLSLVVDGTYNATRTCFASLGSAFIFGFVVSFSILDGCLLYRFSVFLVVHRFLVLLGFLIFTRFLPSALKCFCAPACHGAH